MKHKKSIILAFIILILLATIILISVIFKKTSFSESIKRENIYNLSLTIYYMHPYTLPEETVSVDMLINGWCDAKIYITGSKLRDYIDLLNQLNNVTLIPVDHNTFIDARIYYVFKDKFNRKVFDVCMWGERDSIFVNGLEVKEDDVLYNIIIPFLPEDIVKEMKSYSNKFD